MYLAFKPVSYSLYFQVKNELILFLGSACVCVSKLNFPILAYISYKDDIFRKPRVGCWKDLIKHREYTTAMLQEFLFYNRECENILEIMDKFIDIIEKNDPKNYEVIKDENKNFYS